MAVTKKRNTKKEVVFDSSVLSTPNSYLALAYGALTVLVLFFAIFLAIKLISHRNLLVNQPIQTISDQGISTHREKTNFYTVVEGDSLWSVAQSKYNDGYKWTEIAKANNIDNPGIIEIGQKLTLPDIESVSIVEVTTSAPSPPSMQEGSEKITGTYYTVVEGDSLWTIALRAYGDGYKWVDIMNRNNVETPDIIFPGDKYVLPR